MASKVDNETYDAAIKKLQLELVYLQEWVKKQFQRWVQELTDEIIELKQSGFVDERRTADLIRRQQRDIKDLEESVATKEKKIAHLTERHQIEMHLQL